MIQEEPFQSTFSDIIYTQSKGSQRERENERKKESLLVDKYACVYAIGTSSVYSYIWCFHCFINIVYRFNLQNYVHALQRNNQTLLCISIYCSLSSSVSLVSLQCALWLNTMYKFWNLCVYTVQEWIVCIQDECASVYLRNFQHFQQNENNQFKDQSLNELQN